MSVRRLSCGWEVCSVPDINSTLASAATSGFDFVVCPIVHPRLKRELQHGKAKDQNQLFARSDLLLASQDWSTLVVAKLSHNIDVDSRCAAVRSNHEAYLEQELNYASHLGVPAVMVNLHHGNHTNLARHIHNRVLAGAAFQGLFHVWVRVPLQAPQHLVKRWLNNCSDESQPDNICGDEDFGEDTWHWWRHFHGVCAWDKKVAVALELTADLPSESALVRWLGEPVKCVLLPTAIFLSNKKGYPVLSRTHQILVMKFFMLDTQFVITGVNRHGNIQHYQQYMDFLFQKQPPEDSISQFARGYEDFLQCPLQPLTDNLESQTYEIFEKDPVKYTQYQKAMYLAILDKVNFEEKNTKVLTLMILGAGRGPLVTAALTAAQKADRKVKVYAVEKNPNAVVTLLTQQDEMWGDQVTVVSCDMRIWEPPERADIIISELLGSFGDNELSPECLDGAQKFLKDDGVSIPASYTSYLGPIQSCRLYNEVQLCKEKDKHPHCQFETPYVVRLRNRVDLAEPQPVFTFVHPNKDPVINNSKYKTLVFKIKEDAILHGFAGYFETVLYKNVTISIVPATHSNGMFSWFPMLFPIKEPMYLPKGCDLELHFWRCTNRRNVWYEWCIAKPQVTSVHNPNGRSYTIGL